MAKVARNSATVDATDDVVSNNGHTETANTDAPDTPDTPKVKQMGDQEHKVLELIQKMDAPVSIVDLNAEFGNPIICLAAISSAGKKKWVKLDGVTISVTAEGMAAYENYTPHVRKAREVNPEKAAEREQRMIAKYGPKPEGIGPKPTNLEFCEARLAQAFTSLEYNELVQRMFPYNPTPRENVAKAKRKVANLQSYIEDLRKNPEKANAICSSTKAQEKEDDED